MDCDIEIPANPESTFAWASDRKIPESVEFVESQRSKDQAPVMAPLGSVFAGIDLKLAQTVFFIINKLPLRREPCPLENPLILNVRSNSILCRATEIAALNTLQWLGKG